MVDFNPRSPCGERRSAEIFESGRMEFQSALPLRGATNGNGLVIVLSAISIRAPLAGSDLMLLARYPFTMLFQSALPLRGATYGFSNAFIDKDGFQSALPLRGATPDLHNKTLTHEISIRAPLAGSDALGCRVGLTLRFQSALPLRGATNRLIAIIDSDVISIRAPLAGSDRYIL